MNESKYRPHISKTARQVKDGLERHRKGSFAASFGSGLEERAVFFSSARLAIIVKTVYAIESMR